MPSGRALLARLGQAAFDVPAEDRSAFGERFVVDKQNGVEFGVDWADALLWAATPANAILLTRDKAFAKRAAILGWNVECRLPKAGK